MTMLPMSTNKEWLLKRAAEENGCCVSVGGLYMRIVREEMIRKAAEKVAFTKLLELQRRSLGLSLEDLAERAGVDMVQIIAIARGDGGTAEAQIIRRLAQVLLLPEERLLALAGQGEPTQTNLQEAAARFAARSEPIRQLSAEENEALQEFMHALTEQ
jgi:HTH-type transcriptional regulator, competence development regulator